VALVMIWNVGLHTVYLAFRFRLGMWLGLGLGLRIGLCLWIRTGIGQGLGGSFRPAVAAG